ncbi:hypothetical protein DEJ44_31865 [Streptomyces venezuelae]|nr:hypothetical protein DEJ44_31865 [Streptomyces venezuelae]
MRFSLVQGPPGCSPAPPREADADDAARRVRRTFLVVNAVPLVTGVVLSCSPTLSGAHVHGRLTLGLMGGFLQLGVFLAAVGWYEARSTRLCYPAEQPPASDRLHAGPVSAPSGRETGR